MGNIALRVENLGKQYFIGAKKKKHLFLVESITSAFQDPFRRLKGRVERRESVETKPFWALQNVSFELKHGDVLGIIGRNGSGKSTLLKIISNVLDPSTGQVELYGRVGSLLEVGMGFHPELTGRENIYLSGAIMGMSKAETDGKLDEIIDFSGIEEFIDTPVKRYSSGMYVRLAFSVAAQLDPEILLLDEVLAVGDAVFQKKSLQKMHQVAKDGRTVLFVSHGMANVRKLCDRGIMLSDGLVLKEGTADEVVDHYLNVIDESLKESTLVETLESVPGLIRRIPPDPAFRLTDISVEQHGQPTLTIGNGEQAMIRIEYEVLEETPGLYVFFSLYNHEGTLLFESLHNGDQPRLPVMRPGNYASTAKIPPDLLLPEKHELWIGANIHGVRSCLPEMIKFILDIRRTGRVNVAYPRRRLKGEVGPLIKWETRNKAKMNGAFTAGNHARSYITELIRSLPPDPSFRLRDVVIRQDGRETLAVLNGRPAHIEVVYNVLMPSCGFRVCVDILDEEENLLIRTFHDEDYESVMVTPPGEYASRCVLPANILAPRNYDILIQATIHNVRYCTGTGVRVPLSVASSNGINRAYPHEPIRSKLLPLVSWETQEIRSNPPALHVREV